MTVLEIMALLGFFIALFSLIVQILTLVDHIYSSRR